MRSPSSYPGRASANAACACRHLRLPLARRAADADAAARVAAVAARRSRPSGSRRARGSARARSLQRSTPPAASRRETAATRCGHVSQNVVGNGSPVLVVRRLLGDRGAAERAARGYAAERTRPAAQLALDDGAIIHRPSTLACVFSQRLIPRDDEQLLARLDEAEPPRLARELGVARRGGDETLQLRVLRAQLLHLRRSLRRRCRACAGTSRAGL